MRSGPGNRCADFDATPIDAAAPEISFFFSHCLHHAPLMRWVDCHDEDDLALDEEANDLAIDLMENDLAIDDNVYVDDLTLRLTTTWNLAASLQRFYC